MVTIRLSVDLITHCHQLVAHRNFGVRPTGDNGNHEQQLTGVIGECAMRSLFGKPWMSMDDPACPDNGFDIEYNGIRIDVKTTSSLRMPSIHGVQHMHASQERKYPNVDVYLFTTINKRDSLLLINGWITRIEYVHRRLFLPANTLFVSGTYNMSWPSDRYIIENKYLHFCNSLDDLISQIDFLSKHK